MRGWPLCTVVLLSIIVAAGGSTTARADDGDSATLATTSTLIGKQSVLVIEVLTGPGATVEIDTASPSWNGVEVVRVGKTAERAVGPSVVHRLEVTIAPFLTGTGTFTPAVTIVEGAGVARRLLPPVSWTVIATLNPGDRLELSPLPAPTGIDGAESPFLRPALALGVIAIALAVAGVSLLLVRWLARRPAPVRMVAPGQALPPDLAAAETLLSHDPVAAYRVLATTVRGEIGKRYGFPATALTTTELQSRMELQGVERWHARLVSGLLTECDAVVYAGYRPASERRQADLNMAREIVEGAS